MNKLKWILRLITICCVVLPLLFTVLYYKDNLLGLILPPQVTDAMSGRASMQQTLPDLSISSFQPVYNNDFHFNSSDNSFAFSFNINNPLNNTINVNKLSFSIADGNGTILGSFALDHPVVLIPGQNSTVTISGDVSQDFMNFLQSKGIDLNNLDPHELSNLNLNSSNFHVVNLDLDVGGVQVHMSEFSTGNLGGGNLGGLFGSGNGGN